VKRAAAFAAAASALIVATLVLALLAGCGGSDSSTSTDQTASLADSDAAQVVSADSLRETASSAIPIYWAGERGGTELELSRPDKDRFYVRYLTGDAEAGDERADFLTVGTYRQPNPAASLRRQAKRSGGTITRAPGNATVYYDQKNPGSVYLAFPSKPVEVEVFDPSFKRALRLVESGQIVTVD
jgi:hypothetical protein